MDKIIENLKQQMKKSQPTITPEDGKEKISFIRKMCLFDFVELALFTKYLKEEREDLHHDETIANRKLDTQKDVGKAYSQQHMPTIPQFYEHV